MEDQTTTKPVAAAEAVAKEVYVINDRYTHLPHLITLDAKGKRINLLGKDVKIPREPTTDDPRTELSARGATQEDLKYHYSKGTQPIVEIE